MLLRLAVSKVESAITDEPRFAVLRIIYMEDLEGCQLATILSVFVSVNLQTGQLKFFSVNREHPYYTVLHSQNMCISKLYVVEK